MVFFLPAKSSAYKSLLKKKVLKKKKKEKESTHLREKKKNIFLASISGETLSFPPSAAHHKSSKEIVFKIN